MADGVLSAVLCVDVEPEARRPAAPDPWIGFERLADAADALRDRLATASGADAALTWFLRMDPQVACVWGSATWVVDVHAKRLARLEEAGDELGVHAHSWRFSPHEGWYGDHGDGGWPEHCAASSLDAFERAVGRTPVAYRHGDRYMSTALAGVLHDRGIRVDLTLEPGAGAARALAPDEPSRGVIPAVDRALSTPYCPRRDDVFAVGAPAPGALLEVPLTPGLGLAGHDSVDASLRLWDAPQVFEALLEHRLADPALRHLAFAIRSELLLHSRAAAWFDTNLATLERRLGNRMRWVTASDAYEVLLARAPSGPVSTDEDAGALRSTAGHLEELLRTAETEVDALGSIRQWATASIDGLHAEVDRLRTELADTRREVADADARTADVRAELDELRATRWWRLHDRLLPLLRRLRRG